MRISRVVLNRKQDIDVAEDALTALAPLEVP